MQDMLSLPVPDLSFQEVLRRDSSVQVDLMERGPSPALSRSDIGIQADAPERDIQIQGEWHVRYSSKTTLLWRSSDVANANGMQLERIWNKKRIWKPLERKWHANWNTFRTRNTIKNAFWTHSLLLWVCSFIFLWGWTYFEITYRHVFGLHMTLFYGHFFWKLVCKIFPGPSKWNGFPLSKFIAPERQSIPEWAGQYTSIHVLDY